MKSLLFLALIIASGSAPAQSNKIEISTFQLSDTVYMLMGAGGNVGISTGNDGLYIIDGGLKQATDPLLKAIRKISDKPIRFVFNTHYHGDHTGSNEVLGGSDSVIIAHENIYKRLSTEQVSIFMNSTTAPFAKAALPAVTFNDQLSMVFNGETATAYYVANGHTDGDAIIHFPRSNVIHMGDMFFNGRYPYVDLDAGGSLQGIVAAADLALTLANDSTRIIPGHGPLGVTEDLKNYRDFLIEASTKVQALIDQGMNLEQIITAKPTEQWDEELGKIWITPPQFVTFVYNSLEGVHHYTPRAVVEAKTE